MMRRNIPSYGTFLGLILFGVTAESWSMANANGVVVPIWEKSRPTPRQDVTKAPNRFGAFVGLAVVRAA